MSLNFDDEWLKRLQRQMDEIRRLVDQPAVRAAMRQLQSVQPHLDEVNRALRPQVESINRALRAFHASSTQQQLAAQYRELAEQVQRAVDPWRGRLPQIMEDATRAADAMRASWEAAIPANWRDLSFDEIEAVLDLMDESGWALVWTPRGEIVRMLIEADGEEREQRLLAVEGDVLDDLLAATEGLSSAELKELVDGNRESIACFRDQRFLASQALSTIVFTTLFHRHIDAKFADARSKIEPLDPRDATIANVRVYCVLRSVLVAIDTYYGREDEAIPTRFNRHASAHRLSAEQYTRLNALAAIMLSTSLLRELDARGGLLPDTNN